MKARCKTQLSQLLFFIIRVTYYMDFSLILCTRVVGTLSGNKTNGEVSIAESYRKMNGICMAFKVWTFHPRHVL